jgi:putative membrane protein
MPKSHRTIPVLGAAIAIGIGGAGSTALAHNHHHHHHHGGKVSTADKEYLQTAIEGDRFEIAGGKLAQQQGGSDAVKAYGARLVADHTKSLADAAALARKLGVQVPVAPSPSEQWELETAGQFSGAAFDDRYADLEAKDHQQDIDEAKDEVSDGSNRKVRRSAAEEIPTLKQHLEIAKQLGGEEGTEPLPR